MSAIPANRRQVLATLAVAAVALFAVLVIPTGGSDGSATSEEVAVPRAPSEGSGDWGLSEEGIVRSAADVDSSAAEDNDDTLAMFIRGRVEYVGPAGYSPALDDVWVLVEPGTSVDPVMTGSRFEAFPVAEDGSFVIPVEAEVKEVKLSAAGPGCVAPGDFSADAGRADIVIPLAAVFGGRFRLVDSETVADIRSDFVPPRGGVTTGFSGKGLQRGFRSHLASAFYQAQIPGLQSESPPTLYVTVTGNDADLPLMKVRVAKVGYQELRTTLPLSLLVELPAVQDVAVEPDAALAEDIWFVSGARPGPWDDFNDVYYFSEAQASIVSPETGRVSGSTGRLDLRPGRHLLASAPAGASALGVWLMNWSNFTPESTAGRHLDLPIERGTEGTVATLSPGSVSAVGIPAKSAPAHAHAWVGLLSPGLAGPIGTRYDVATGIVIDGLVPGDYDVFWASVRLGYKQIVNENRPTMTIRLVPGLQQLPVSK